MRHRSAPRPPIEENTWRARTAARRIGSCTTAPWPQASKVPSLLRAAAQSGPKTSWINEVVASSTGGANRVSQSPQQATRDADRENAHPPESSCRASSSNCPAGVAHRCDAWQSPQHTAPPSAARIPHAKRRPVSSRERGTLGAGVIGGLTDVSPPKHQGVPSVRSRHVCVALAATARASNSWLTLWFAPLRRGQQEETTPRQTKRRRKWRAERTAARDDGATFERPPDIDARGTGRGDRSPSSSRWYVRRAQCEW